MWGGAVPVALSVAPSTGTGAWVCLLSTWELLQKKAGSFGIYKCKSRHSSLTDLAMGSQGTLEGYPPPWT